LAIKITKIKLDSKIPVYDLSVENTHSFFANDVVVHNCEITLPTQTFDDVNQAHDPTVALCTLSAINWGKVREPKDFEKPCLLAVRALDALLDYQEYPLKGAERHSKMFRPLGVGIIGFAHWMAKNGFKYSDDSALKTLDVYSEAWSYYLTRASIDLAKEFGPCEGNGLTKYSYGILPIDTRKSDIDTIVPYEERLPWNKLREDLKIYGIRNSTLMACMPAETSAQIAGETNGIEPVRSLITIKQSKDGVLKQVVPEYRRLKNKYELLWNQKSPEGYLKIVAVLQKYIDQTISCNVSYNPEFYPDNQLPMSEMIKHLLLSYKLGIKTHYYLNTNDGQSEYNADKMIAVSQNQIDNGDDDAESCTACKL